MMNVEQAARRYIQIRDTERALELCEGSISEVNGKVVELEERLKELRKTKRNLEKDMRAFARDEGQIPLFDLGESLSMGVAIASV